MSNLQSTHKTHTIILIHTEKSQHLFIIKNMEQESGMVVHTCGPRTQKAGTGGLPQVLGHPGLFSMSLGYIVKPYLKNKKY